MTTTTTSLGLPIVVDTPSLRAGMVFDRYVAGVAAAIRGGNPARYTVGLFGPWGSGKSSLLQGIADTLADDSDDEIIVVRFDAWRYQSSGSLVFALLQTIKRSVDKRPGMAAAAGAISAVLDRFEVSFLGVGLKYQRREPNSNEQYIAPFDDLTALSKTLLGQRIVILVDDLDRCSPTSVVSIIEAIHLLTDVDGFVFVLALDYDYLIDAIGKAYQDIDAHRFIEKIVQIPFRIPAVNVQAGDIKALLPEWETRLSPWFAGVDAATLVEIIYLALRSNPRQVKRLVNTYLLAQHMAGRSPEALSASETEGGTSHLLLHFLALQLAWPIEYEELTRAIRDAALSSPNDTLDNVAGFQDLVELSEGADWNDARLSRFLTKGFDRTVLLRDLLPTMDLTASVAMSIPASRNESDDSSTADESRDHSRDVDAAPAPLRDLFRNLEGDARALDPTTTSKPNKRYIAITRATKSFKNRVFATLELLPNRVVVIVPLPYEDLPADLRSEEVKPTSNSRGYVSVRVYPDDAVSVDTAKRIIRLSYDRLSTLGAPVGESPGDEDNRTSV